MREMINRVKDEVLYTILVMMLDRQDTHATRIDRLEKDLRTLQDKDIIDDRELREALKAIEEESQNRKKLLWSALGTTIAGVIGIILSRIF